MRITENDHKQVTFEGRVVSQRGWLVWGALFLPGMLALIAFDPSIRLIALIVWMVVWLALIAVVPRLLGDLVQVTIDGKQRQVMFIRNGQQTRVVPFSDIKQFNADSLATASRPYKTFVLYAELKGGGRISVAVDPHETVIQNALRAARARFR